MIGPRIGPRFGEVIGPRIGCGVDELGSVSLSGVTQDAASKKYFPASTAEWNSFISQTGMPYSAPTSIYNFQDLSGNPVDVGSDNITLTAAGTVSYQNSVAGYTRKSCDTADGGANLFGSTSATLPDISVTSMAVLLVWRAPTSAPAASRTLLYLGDTVKGAAFKVDNTPVLTFNIGGNAANGGSPINTVKILLAKVDVTNTLARGYTDTDKLAPAWDAPNSGKRLNFGISPSPNSGNLWACVWKGAQAEKFTDGVTKSTLQLLNWSVSGW